MFGWHWRLVRQCEVRDNAAARQLILKGLLTRIQVEKLVLGTQLVPHTGGQAASATPVVCVHSRNKKRVSSPVDDTLLIVRSERQ